MLKQLQAEDRAGVAMVAYWLGMAASRLLIAASRLWTAVGLQLVVVIVVVEYTTAGTVMVFVAV